MKTKTAGTRTFNRLLMVSLLALGLAAPGAASASKGNPVVEVAGMEFNAGHSMQENLKAHLGKRLTLYLSSGAQITGSVKAVGEHMVYLEKITRRDFMDALVRIETIEAIEGQFRAYQRDLERMGLKEKK